jgi:hypothetical protein
LPPLVQSIQDCLGELVSVTREPKDRVFSD